MRIGKKKSCTAGILMAALLLAGCGVGAGRAQAEEERPGEAVINTPVKEEEPGREVSYSLWNAYWNLEGVEAQTDELAAKKFTFFTYAASRGKLLQFSVAGHKNRIL